MPTDTRTPDPLREALTKAIAAIDDPTRYIEVNSHYRAGWIDALTALRDDPAIRAADDVLAALHNAKSVIRLGNPE